MQSYTLTRKTEIIAFQYKIDNTNINKVDTIKDLRIILNENLTFGDYNMDLMCAGAFRTMDFIKRNTDDFRNTYSLIHLLYSLIKF